MIAARRPGLLRRIYDHRWDYAYIAPALGVMMLVIAYPVYFTVYLSFFNTPPNLSLDDKIFTGLENYTRIMAAESFHEATWNTLVWTVYSTGLAYVMGFAAAIALNHEFRGRGLLRGTLLVPYVISAVAASYVWRWLYHSDFGVIGAISVALGVTDKPINFLDSRAMAMPSLIVVNVWKEFPFAMIMMLAGLQTVPDQLLRAAQVDGANAWQRFWHITMPHVKNVSVVTVLLLLVTNLNSFTIPYIMTGGGPAGATETLGILVYREAFGSFRFGTAAALGVLMLATAALIVLVGLRRLRDDIK